MREITDSRLNYSTKYEKEITGLRYDSGYKEEMTVGELHRLSIVGNTRRYSFILAIGTSMSSREES